MIAPVVLAPVVLACVVLAGALAAGPVVGAQVTPTPTPTLTATLDRVVRDDAIDEGSGLAASGRHDGVLWIVEDSGQPEVLTAVDPSGATAARLRVREVSAEDWEALAPLTLPDGSPALAVGDIGDNRALRPFVDVVVVAEPGRLRDARVDPRVTLRLTYPDRPGDAEALLADPRDGRLYVVGKDLLSATVYAVPAPVWPASATADDGRVVEGELEPVATLGFPLVTDGAVLSDGRLVLRNYGAVAVFPPVEQLGGGTVRATATDRLPQQEQGESLALVDGGAAVLLHSEGTNQPVLRVATPSTPTRPAPSTATTGSRSSAGATQPQPVESGGGSEPLTTGSWGGWRVLLFGAAAGAGTAAALWAALRQRAGPPAGRGRRRP